MGHRSRKHRKRFACGHRGFGRYCHRCADEARRRRKRQRDWEARYQERRDWLDLYAADPVDLRGLPRPIVRKAREVMGRLAQGVDLKLLRGKRFGFERRLIRLPVTLRYRLLCWQGKEGIEPLRLMSHEAYNPVVRNQRRIRGGED